MRPLRFGFSCALGALFAVSVAPLAAQLPLGYVAARGQTVTPAYEGWYDNPDGNFADMCPDTPTSPNVQTRLPGIDRQGCPDADFDGYSDPDAEWTVEMGADACPEEGYDALLTSTMDRAGCLDSDGDGWSDPTDSWTVAMGADAFPQDPTKWEAEPEEVADGSSSVVRTVLMVGGLVLILAGMGAALMLRGGREDAAVKIGRAHV